MDHNEEELKDLENKMSQEFDKIIKNKEMISKKE